MFEAVKKGINIFDTSPYYGTTRSESVLGKAFGQLPRDSYVICTKVGRYGADNFDFSAGRVIQSVDESMKRLGVDVLDVVQCHDIEFGDLDQVITETIPTLNKLKEDGKIKAIGITGYPLEIFPYVLSCVNPGMVDIVLSYCNYNLQNDRLGLLLPALKHKFGVGVINASPLCMGLLTPSGGPDWHPADDDIKSTCKIASQVCQNNGDSLPNVAMKFAMNADPDFIATTLVGIDSIDTLDKNIASLNDLNSPLIETVRGILKPVRNRRWSSGAFI